MNIMNMLPRRYYTVEGSQILMTNFTANVNITEATKRQSALFIDYKVVENETARQIANRLYENPELEWTIYVVNNIVNSVNDWPMRNFERQIRVQYTQEELDELIGYADTDRNMVDLLGLRHMYGWDDDTPSDSEIISRFSLTPVTRLELLRMENEKKRSIRLIDPDFVEQFAEYVREALQDG